MALTAPASAPIAASAALTGSPVFGTCTVNEPCRPAIVNVISYRSVSVPAGSTCCVSVTDTTGTPLPYNPAHPPSERPRPGERRRRLHPQLAHQARPGCVRLVLAAERPAGVGRAERVIVAVFGQLVLDAAAVALRVERRAGVLPVARPASVVRHVLRRHAATTLRPIAGRCEGRRWQRRCSLPRFGGP